MATPKTTTMSDGGTESAAVSQGNLAPQSKVMEERDKADTGKKAKNMERSKQETVETPRRRGRPAGSKNKTKVQSKSRSPSRGRPRTRRTTESRTPTAKGSRDSKSKTSQTTATLPKTPEAIDLTGSKGRSIKQEMIDQSEKIQQTISFPMKRAADLTRTETWAPTSAENPYEIEDDEDQGTTRSDTSNSTATPKRKQSEMTKGVGKIPDGIPKRKTLNSEYPRMHTQGRGIMGGRGHAGGRGGGIPRITQEDRAMREPEKADPTVSNVKETDAMAAEPPQTYNQVNTSENFEPLKRGERTGTPGKEYESGVHNTNSPKEPHKDEDTPTKRGGLQTPQGKSKLQKDNKDYKEAHTHMDSPKRLNNPYKTIERPVPVTYAAITKSSQTKLKTHTKIKEAHDSFYEITFYARELSKNPSMAEVIAVLKAQLRSILLRAKEVDRKAKINTWMDRKDLPTITKIEDIPDRAEELKSYLSPLIKDKAIVTGRNSNWRVRITTNIPRQEFVHHWGLSKRDYTKTAYIPLRNAPLQAPTYHAAGYFLNSSDGQRTQTLEEEFTKLLGYKVGVVYKSAALHKRAADEF